MGENEYSAANITVLEGLEPVRKRPGMYVGDVHNGSGLHHLFREVLANALDQHLAGHCNQIAVELGADGSCTVEDDGLGIPAEGLEGRFIERMMTTLHAGSTFDGHYPHDHIASHGVGLSPVNALSAWALVETFRGGIHYRQRFARGFKASELERLGTTERRGTRMSFLPDAEIFSECSFSRRKIEQKLVELALALPTVSFSLCDRRAEIIRRPSGFRSLVEGKGDFSASPFCVHQEVDGVRIEAVAAWSDTGTAQIESYANYCRTSGGGTHEEGLFLGLREGLRLAAEDVTNWSECAEEAELRRGLTAAVCVRLADIEYDSPTRSQLATRRVGSLVHRLVAREFAAYLRGEPALLEHLTRRMRAE
ncbi:MAG: hypothetical protein H6718_24160 [Polyangiaceae bacterium]|nr:hypothetical protein [Myxococcales bacterium]MCB9588525.1 hypothetical protein [Polyangiaceae bacterium]